MRSWVRWVLAGIGSLLIFLTPPAWELIKYAADKLGVWERPRETINIVANFLQALWANLWVNRIAFLLLGVSIGLWLDVLLKKVDGSRAEAIVDLGTEMKVLAHDIQSELNNNTRFQWPGYFVPKLMSLSARTKQLGVTFPKPGASAGHLLAYLTVVGTLLGDGLFAEAKEQAKNVTT